MEWSDGVRGREGGGCGVKGEWYSHIVPCFCWWVVSIICEQSFSYVGGCFHTWTVVWAVFSIRERSSSYMGGWRSCSWLLSLSSSWW